MKPIRMYFAGGSQGGHEAFTVVQRWPRDYDGVISFFPVFNFVPVQVAGVLIGQALYSTPGAWLSPSKVRHLTDKVYEACDSLDGLQDGVISNVGACDAHFRLEDLRCPGGVDTGDACLSDPQLAMVRKITSPVSLGVTVASGSSLPKWPLLEGGRAEGFLSIFGELPHTSRPPVGGTSSFVYVMGDQFVRYMVLGEPSYDSMNFDPVRNAERLQKLSAMLDTVDPDISAFERRNGKLIILHGTVDMAVSRYSTIAYVERMKSLFGEDRLHRFVRFYVAPGYGHGDGPFQIGWDALSTLNLWADQGITPLPQTVVDTAKATAGRRMPLCEFPSFPRYDGKSDVKLSSSYSCAFQ
jgi:feruloyl esterase